MERADEAITPNELFLGCSLFEVIKVVSSGDFVKVQILPPVKCVLIPLV